VPPEQLPDLYVEMLTIMRVMYRKCKLIHADLSEYNVLYHQCHLYVIDVSQSVEQDHPRAFDFLRSDIRNIEDFFGKGGIHTLGVKATFDFITSRSLASTNSNSTQEGEETSGDISSAISFLMSSALSQHAEEDSTDAAHQARITSNDDAVFAKSFIPRTLNEVYDAERDVARVLRGEGKDLIYASVTGVADANAVLSRSANDDIADDPSPRDGDGQVRSDEDASSDRTLSNPSESDSDEDDSRPAHKKGKKFEDPEAKKERKKALKEENREKRKHKMPKGEKKRRVKHTSGKK